jgi:hypothetical protein
MAPEEKREYKRQWTIANRDRVRENQRRWREANRDKLRVQKAAQYQANRAERRSRDRLYYTENREKVRKIQAAYKQTDAYRKSRARTEAKQRWYHLGRNHGLDITEWWAIWEAQDGKCYACSRDLDEDPKKTHVEHYHGCRAHEPKKSCRYCRRGLACASCNLILGLSGDDPAVLRQIADRLEAANRDVEARQANAPEQLKLEFEETA